MTAGESEDPVLLAVDEAVLAAGVEGNSGDKSGSEMSDAVVARGTGPGPRGTGARDGRAPTLPWSADGSGRRRVGGSSYAHLPTPRRPWISRSTDRGR